MSLKPRSWSSKEGKLTSQYLKAMGGTYAGNAVSCAAGIACAEVMKEDNILENVDARSKQMLEMLHGLEKDPLTAPLIAEVRGLGLVCALPDKTMFAVVTTASANTFVQNRCWDLNSNHQHPPTHPRPLRPQFPPKSRPEFKRNVSRTTC